MPRTRMTHSVTTTPVFTATTVDPNVSEDAPAAPAEPSTAPDAEAAAATTEKKGAAK